MNHCHFSLRYVFHKHHIWGCRLQVPRSVINRYLGGLQELFGVPYQDNEACKRFKEDPLMYVQRLL